MIILLTGLPGTGKTEVAKFISQKISDSIIIRNDEIRRELFGVEGGKGFSEDQTALINKTVIEKMTVAIKAGQTVVLDRVSPSEEEREMMRGLAQDLGTSFVLVSVSASEAVTKQRIEERLINDPLGVPFSVYTYWVDKYEPVSTMNYSIVNDGDLSDLEKKVEEVLQKINM